VTSPASDTSISDCSPREFFTAKRLVHADVRPRQLKVTLGKPALNTSTPLSNVKVRVVGVPDPKSIVTS
jgi:hypothetical protein